MMHLAFAFPDFFCDCTEMVVVERLEDIIAEERQLEDELRRLSLNFSKAEPSAFVETLPIEIPVARKPTISTTVIKSVNILNQLRAINTIPQSYSDIRKSAAHKPLGD